MPDHADDRKITFQKLSDDELQALGRDRATLSQAESDALDWELQSRARVAGRPRQPESEALLGQRPWRYLIGLAVLVTVLPFVYDAYRQTKGPSASSPSAIYPVETRQAPVRAEVTTYPGLELDEDQLSPMILYGLERWINELVIKNAMANRAALGHGESYKPDVDSSSTIVEHAGRTLAVIRNTIDSRIQIVTILGLHGGELVKVSCMRASKHEIPLFEGECGEALATAFNLTRAP